MTGDEEMLRRWRLVLGRYARPVFAPPMSGDDPERERMLDYLYDRDYEARDEAGASGSEPSRLAVPVWLARVRTLFPRETVERIEAHALERYRLRELLQDGEVLTRLEPSPELLRLVLSFRRAVAPELLPLVRSLAERVTREIMDRLRPEVAGAIQGRRNPFERSTVRVAANFDWRATVRANLRNRDRRSGRIIFARLIFSSRRHRRLPWHIILCVDQSGSMFSNILHAAVMAAILARLPAVTTTLVLFDTAVVDLTGAAEDPAEVMMSVQLGGGTNIAGAVGYCAGKVANPKRTVLALISDFCEGGPREALIAAVRRLTEAGVVLLGLAALDERANPNYDRDMAARLAEAGMPIAALTPRQFAAWLGEVLR
ncbi:MAG: VWA domain-containing protein [Azospirillum sp.]|nr:VWA domain-containing protein [Azospirillum sp.]